MSGRKALPNQTKSSVRSRQAIVQASPPVDLTAVEADIAALEAVDTALDARVTQNETDIAALEAFDATLGTAAFEDIGTSGATVPLLNTTNTWSAGQHFQEISFNGLTSDIIRRWSPTDTSIDALVPGSSEGLLIQGAVNSHVVIGIQGNDSNDGLYVLDTNNGGVAAYANSLLALTNNNFQYKGSNIAHASATMAWTGSHNFSTGAVRFESGAFVGPSTNEGYIYGSLDDSIGIRTGASGSYKYFRFHQDGTFQVLNGGMTATGQSSITAASSLPLLLTRTGSSGGLGFRLTNTAGYIDLFAVPVGTDAGSFVPGTDNAVDLGTSANSWKDGYFDGTVNASRLQVGTFYMDDNIGLGADIPGFSFDSNDWFAFNRAGNYFTWAMASTERLRLNSGTTRTLEINGRMNFTTAIGTSRSVIDWGYTQSGLTISNEDNTPLSLRTSATNRIVVSATGEVDFGTSTTQTDSRIRLRKNGNNIEWGHTNTAGYHGTLGAFAGSGDPYISFSSEAGTTSNTFRTRGRYGGVIYVGGGDGRMYFGHLADHTADNQSLAIGMTLTRDGNLGLGTTSPANFGSGWRAMTIGESGKNGVLRLSSGTVVADMFTDTTALYLRTATAHSMVLRTNDTDRLIIDNTGKATLNSKTLARVNSGTATNSGLISWGTAAPGTLAEGEIYLRHA